MYPHAELTLRHVRHDTEQVLWLANVLNVLVQEVRSVAFLK